MSEISPVQLAQNIHIYLQEGMRIEDIRDSAYAEGISEEIFEAAMLLLRKGRIHQKVRKQKKFALNVSVGVILSIMMMVVSFIGFVYKDKLTKHFFSAETLKDETEMAIIPENIELEKVNESMKESFSEGRYDMSHRNQEASKVKIDKTRKILSDFELRVRDVGDVSKNEWETILESIVKLPTLTIDNNQIYLFEFEKKGEWKGFWIYKNKIILATPLSGEVSDFFVKDEMRNILINYKSDLLENDFFFIDQFKIFDELNSEKMEKIRKLRETLKPLFEKMIDTSSTEYFVDSMSIRKNNKTEEVEGYSINFEGYNDEKKTRVDIYPIEFAALAKKMKPEALLEEMNASKFRRRIRRNMVLDSRGTVMWPSGDYVLEVDNHDQDLIDEFLKKYKSDL